MGNDIILGLVITAVSYGLIPLLIASSRTKHITIQRYCAYCYLGNILVMVLFIIFNGGSNGAPYILWTSVFCYVGKSILKERNLIAAKVAPEQSLKLNVTPDMFKFICDECSTISISWYNECPHCHAAGKIRKGTDDEIRTWNNLSLENVPSDISVQNVVEEETEEIKDTEPVTASSKIEAVPVQNNNGGSNMYCMYCGTEHTAQQKYCAVCGKALQGEDKPKKKKPIATIVLSCLTGLFAISTITLGLFMPRQYQAGYEEGHARGYTEGEASGYEAGYSEGIELFDEGYALGWAQKQAVIDADITQTPEYKSWAKAHPELGKTNVDDELKAIYNVLHIDIDNWYNNWQESAFDRYRDKSKNSGALVDFDKYFVLNRILPYSINALHNIVDNMMLLENDHLEANSIFFSSYGELTGALIESGALSSMTRYEEWLSAHPEK